MMKKLLLSTVFIALAGFGFGQITISSQDFETNLSGYSHTPSQIPADDVGDQYFHRAEPSDAAIYEGSVGPYTNVTNNWLFVGSNPNSINGGSPGILTLDPITVTGYTNLEFHSDFGACDNDWDASDDLKVEYNFDGGSWATLFYFEAYGDGTNEPLELTGNSTGGLNTANGTVLTYALTTISSDNFTGSGTTLNIRIVQDAGANYEAFGVDNILIKGVTAGGVSNPTDFTSTTSSTSQIDLAATANGNGNNIMVAYNSTNTFGDPTGSYSVGNSITGGGTVHYVGAAASLTNHSGLSADQTVYYKAWSVDGSNNYSSGLTDDATTYKDEPTNHVTVFSSAVGTPTQSSIDLTWVDATGTVLPENYLIIASSVSYADISNPVDGTAIPDGGLILNIAQGIEMTTFTGLTESTPYYFKIYPYTNTGTAIDYKTDGTIPQSTVTTTAAPIQPTTWINEFHYDNGGGDDVNEFVEIVIKNAGSYSLSDFAVYKYNGNGGASYGNETIDNFTVGVTENNFTIYTFVYPTNGIQNGAPDGFAISYQGTLITGQFLSYEGTFTAVGGPADGILSTDIGVSESNSTPAGQSLQLLGSGTVYTDFTWQAPATETPGALNNSQTLGGAASVAMPVITPASGDYFAPISVSISTSTDGASIYYTTNGSDPNNTSTSYTVPFAVNSTTTVKAIAYKAGMTESAIATNDYNYPTVTNMATIAALRAETAGTGAFYNLSQEVVITFQQDYRGNKYVQDASAAILIDDPSGNITTTYNVYDGITGILGNLSTYGGMLQFVPLTDPGAATSNGNTITPEVVSLTQLTNNFEDYEAELVKVEGVSFNDAGSTFSNETVYPLTDAIATPYDFRTTFFDVSYIGSFIPFGPQDIVVLPHSRTDGEYIASRFNTDINPSSGGNSAEKLDIIHVNNGNGVYDGQPFSINVQAQDINGLPANVDADVNVTLSIGVGTGTLAGTITGTIPLGSNTVIISDITYTPFETGVVLDIVDDASNLTAGNSDAFDVLEIVDVDLVITEIMYNAMGGTDTLEYFELYNNGAADVNLEDYTITQGVTHTFGDVTIAAGDYLVVAFSAANMMDAFGVTAEEWTSGGLTNSGEDIEITNAFNMVVAYVDYGVSDPWPVKETGKSIRFCDPDLDNNDPANWSISVEYLAIIEGEDMFGTPDAACGSANPATQLDITNVNNGLTVYDGELFSVVVKSKDVNGAVASVDTDVNVTLTIGTGTGSLGGTVTGMIASGTNSVTITDITYSPFEMGVVLNVNDDASNLTMGNSDAFDVNQVILLDIVINEIMYNTPDVDEEWIELYNNTTATIDLENWQVLDDDDDHTPITITAGHSIAAGEYFTISIATAGNFPFVADFDGTGNFSLNNSSDNVRLFSPESFLVDNVNYFDTAPWPTEPDGNGPSLALLDPSMDNNLPASWAASVQNGGSPGAINFPPVPFISLTAPNGGEMIQQDTDFDITWTSGNFTGDIKIELFRDGQTPVEIATDIDASLGTYTWSVTTAVEIAADYKISVTALIAEVTTDESDDFFSVIEFYVIPNLVFTEIMYNPPESGDDSLEFLEIYNNSEETVALEGFHFTQGVVYTFPAMDLLADAYLLLSIDSLAMMSTFNVDAYQWTSGGLSNGGEDIELRDSFDNVIDFVEYDDSLPWDTLADGFGPSLTLCNPDSDNNIAENWTASEYFMTENAAGDSIWATPGFGCQVSLLAQLDADVTLLLVGESVQFTDQTIGNPISWMWTFEGGTPATYNGQTPPPVVYNTAGTWDVSLTVDDGVTTNSVNYTDYIRSGVDPVADFEATFTTVTVGSYTNFVDMSIGEDLDYEWYFEGGDPETSDLDDPGDIYYLIADVTTYDVRLIVSNDFGVDTLLKVDYINTIADAIPESNLNESTFSIYPNPASSNLTIVIPLNSEIKIDVYSMEGRLIVSKVVTTTETLDIDSFENGMYLIRATDTENKNSIYEKLIKN